MVADSTTVTFTTGTSDVPYMSVSTFTATNGIVCYTDPTLQAPKGVCKPILYSDVNTPLAVNSAPSMWATFAVGYAPTSLTVAGYSQTNAVVCWMDATTTRGKCRILFLAGTQLKPVGTEITVSLNTLTHMSIDPFGSVYLGLCFNEALNAALDTGQISCLLLKASGTDLGASDSVPITSVKGTDVSFCSCAASAGMVCYKIGSENRCSTIETVSEMMHKKFETAVAVAGGGTYISVSAFDEYTGALCYHDGANGYAACVAIQGIVASASSCSYTMPGYTCTDALCSGGVWGENSTCNPAEASCKVSDINTFPIAANKYTDPVCENQFGAETLIGESTGNSYEASTAISEYNAVVCYSTGSRANCYGVTRDKTTLLRGDNVALLNDATTTGTVMVPLNKATALVCYSNVQSSSQGTCKALVFSNGDVTVAGVTRITFTNYDVSATLIALAAFSPTRAVVCYANGGTSGICKTLGYTDSSSAITQTTNNFVFTNTVPTSVSVGTFSPTQGLACWMDAHDSISVVAKCQVIVRDETALTGPGEVLEISSGNANYLAIATFSDTIAIVCCQDGTSVWCKTLTLVTDSNMLTAGPTYYVNDAGGSYITVTTDAMDTHAHSDAHTHDEGTTATVCYKAGFETECAVLTRTGTKLSKNVGGLILDDGDAAADDDHGAA